MVGEIPEQQTFHLQETLLRSISPVFKAALGNEHLGDEEEGVLAFPEDHVDAWKTLLYWSFKRTLPCQEREGETISDEEQLVLVRSWVLGDKYRIPVFQDIAILEILANLQSSRLTAQSAKEAARHTAVDSPLRRLAVRSVVESIRDAGLDHEEYNEAFEVPGFATETLRLLRDSYVYDDVDGQLDEIGDKDGKNRSDAWAEYMVAGGPPEHWIYNNKARGE